MDQGLVDELINALDTEEVPSGDDFVCPKVVAYNKIVLDKDNFKDIPITDSDKKICFIDGGNQELIKSPNVSLQFIRVYYTIYQHNKRIKNEKFEFYALLKLKDSQSRDNIAEVKIFNSDLLPDLEFDLSDFESEANLSTVGNLIRRIAEIKAATLAETDFIVLDGSLFAPTKIEQEYLEELFNTDATIVALSKTSHLTTDKGVSASTALLDLKPDLDSWTYHPVADIDDSRQRADLYFALLNKHSRYIFLVELKKGSKPAGLFSLLKQNSTDPVFKGYPYGLVEADKFARISNSEKERLRLQIMAKAGKSWKTITEAENPLNAHSILDNIL